MGFVNVSCVNKRFSEVVDSLAGNLVLCDSFTYIISLQIGWTIVTLETGCRLGRKAIMKS